MYNRNIKYVERLLYFNRIRPFADNGNVKIIAGIRRSGKSTLLKELGRVTDCKILHIDMELWENRRFRDPDQYTSTSAKLSETVSIQ